MKKRGRLILTGIMIAVTILSACSNKQTTTTNEAVNDVRSEETLLNIVNGKLDPPQSFTTIGFSSPAGKFREGENETDNVHTRWAKETLGVEIKTLWTGGLTDGSFNTKLKLMLASGDKLPDIITVLSSNDLHMLINTGKFMAVDEAYEKYASPLYKSYIEEDPSVWDHVTIEGKRMALVRANADIGQANNVLWIRQDWLDKFNLQPPANIEELEHVMDIFANQDPDGNGQKDTIALGIGMKDKIAGQTLGDSSWIFGMFGAVPERWYPGEDGKLQYGSVQPEIKDALLKLNEWKNKGYLASDVAIHDANTIIPAVAANKIGIIAAPNYFMAYPGSLLLTSVPTASYTPHPIPAGPNGSVMRTGFNMTGGTLINKDISEEALQAYFHYINYIHEGAEDPTLFKGFQEGYDYVIEDGEFVENEDAVPTGDYFGGIPVRPSTLKEKYMKLINNEPIPQEEKLKYLTLPNPSNPTDKTMLDAIAVAITQPEANIKQYYVGPVTPTMNSREALLQKAQMETYSKIIYGEAGAEAFETYVKQYYSMGGSTITEEVNQWYEALPKNTK